MGKKIKVYEIWDKATNSVSLWTRGGIILWEKRWKKKGKKK